MYANRLPKNTKMIMPSAEANSICCCQSFLITLTALTFICVLQFEMIRAAFEEGNNNNVKIAEHSLELTQTINIQRQEYLQKQCETLGYTALTLDDLTDEQMDHMIVDKEHKFLYCYVPKVSDKFVINKTLVWIRSTCIMEVKELIIKLKTMVLVHSSHFIFRF